MIKFIERPNQVLCNKIAEAVFGDKHKASFSEQFVPIQGHVPNPKMSNFSLFLNSSNCKFLWAILDPQDHEVVVGFILIADMPQNHSIGVGIDVNYANKGLMYNAMQEVMIDITSKGIRFPINAHTSVDNIAANKLLLKLGFEFNGLVNDHFGVHNHYVIK